MLATNPSGTSPLKQGWVLKKGGSGFLAHWRLKYLVLAGGSEYTKGDARLLVYDQVDQSRPPKHEIWLRDATVDILVGNKTSGVKKGAAPFIVSDRKRKFYFAAQTRGDRDDWLAILKAPSPTHHASRATITGARSASRLATQSPGMRRSNSVRYRSYSRQREDDAMSTCSFETDVQDTSDAVSVYSMASSRAVGSSMEDGRSSVASSRVETLSFCSEPVLTPQELTLMGNSNASSASYRNEDGFTFRDTFRRRRAPISDTFAQTFTEPEPWNARYQALLATLCTTEEAVLRQDIALHDLIGQFREAAQQIARTMVDEYHLGKSAVAGKGRPMSPGSSETLSMDGPLGVGQSGEVMQDGIVARFACEYDECSIEQLQQSHAQTSHELLALNAITRASFRGHSAPLLHTILMVLIDYKGFRIVAYADTNTNQKPICVHNLCRDPPKTDEGASERLTKVGQVLGLKSHVVKIGEERRVACALARDVEVHFHPSSKLYYASNLHSLFPPDALALTSPATPPTQVLRPEFLSLHTASLTCDAFTSSAGATRRERETNDAEVARAVKSLRGVHVPAFVARLDALEIRVVDSRGLVGEMHAAGINVRYLGHVARLSTLPYIRSLARTEICARSFKSLFQTRIRSAIMHFKSVGATNIDEEMKTYAVGMFSGVLGGGDKSRRYFEERLRGEMESKFEYTMTWAVFEELHKPSLFLAMQSHCGVSFAETTDYDFSQAAPIPRSSFLSFTPRIKQPIGLSQLLSSTSPTPEDERLAYHLARHFKSLGPNSKLSRSDASSAALAQVSAHYNATQRYEEARLYAQASVSAATRNSCLAGLAMGLLIEAIAKEGKEGDERKIVGIYEQAVGIVLWHCGNDHPVVMGLHDRMAGVYERSKKFAKALEYYGCSLKVAEKALGKNHLVTAGYLVKIGSLYHSLNNPTESIARFTEALHLYQGLNAALPLVAHLHYHFAQPLGERGDLDSAITHSQRARRMYEKVFGQADPRTVEACRQVAKLVLMPYGRYEGVLTPVIRNAYKEAVGCYEKVFRFVKSSRSGACEGRKSLVSVVEAVPTNPSPPLLGTSSYPTPISGPLITPTMLHPLPQHPRSLLHSLTRQIISLKLRLVDSPQHREIVRTLRAQNKDKVLSSGEARGVVLRLAAVSPSVYLDGVMGRIEEGDGSAVDELGVVLMLTEGEIVGLDG
ncbi:translation initiation factor eIF3 subunit 135-domain-containing protein [Powellomyces hirtus]|nr:translation initiation factor eIF3 subunit 135-domain-containing protein [Powellomyces hirtus]